jgi:uncharacterized protein (TIGR00255 family)
MNSMTGYGRGEATAGGKRFIAEIKSLNHRFLDIRCRTPRTHNFLELKIHQLIQVHFHRGRFDVEIRLESDPSLSEIRKPDLNRARALVSALNQLRESLGLTGEISLELIASRSEIWEPEPAPAELESDWEPIQKAILNAFAELKQMREKEGEMVAREFQQRLERIEEMTGQISGQAQGLVSRIRERIAETVRNALGPTPSPNPERLEQEIVFWAERSDISEELSRLKSHLQNFREIMKANEVGKKLEFLVQEMGRETNTIGSKSILVEISNRVIEIKLELEKIREQVQNLE